MFLKKMELTKRSILWVGCFIFFLALFVRLLYLYESSDNPAFKAPIVDARGYDRLARVFVQEGRIEEQFFWQQFFYPFFLSIVYFFSNCSIISAKIIQAVLGSLTCVLTFLLARKIFNFRIAVVAALLVIFYGPLIFHESDLITAGWEAFWAVAVVWLFLKAADKQNLWINFVLGICGALSILTKPNFLGFFLAAGIWLCVVKWRSLKQLNSSLKNLPPILTGLIIILLPVAALNYRVTGRFGVLPASGGINLYIGNNPDFDAAQLRPGPKWEKIANMPKEYGVSGNMWDQQKFFYEKTYNYITAHPASFLRGLAVKTMQVLSSREMPGNVDIYPFRKFSTLLSLLMWRQGAFGFPFGVILPLSLVGLVYFWRQTPIPVKFFLLIYPLPLILTHIESRYRIAMIPILSIMAAAGIDTLTGLIRIRRWTKLAGAVVLIILAGLSVTLPGPFPAEKPDYLPELYNNVGITLGSQGKIEEAVENYKKAIQLSPEYSEAYYNLGVMYYRQGKIDLAIANYEKSLQIDPNSYMCHYNLGVAFYTAGNFELAKTHYLRALQLKSDYILAYKAMAMDSVRRGELDEAIDYYKKALEIDDEDIDAHYQLGLLLIQRNHISLAVQEFEKVLQLNPNHSDAKQILLHLQELQSK